MGVMAIGTSGGPGTMLVPEDGAAMILLGRDPRLAPVMADHADPANRRFMVELVIEGAGSILPPEGVGMAATAADAVGLVVGGVDNRRRGARRHPTKHQYAPPENVFNLHFDPVHL